MGSPSLSSVKPDYTLGKITGISSFWLLEHLRAYFYLFLLMRITAYTSIHMITKAAQLAQYGRHLVLVHFITKLYGSHFYLGNKRLLEVCFRHEIRTKQQRMNVVQR